MYTTLSIFYFYPVFYHQLQNDITITVREKEREKNKKLVRSF